jgi:hypothetical protein
MVFVRGHNGAHLGAVAAESTRVDGVEAIEIHETVAPAVDARPVDPLIQILPYSEAAIRDDEWVRAWMTLEIDEAGKVRPVRWIHRPGHDLDAIALRAAFDVPFVPARDRSKRVMATQLVWMFEWPSHTWLMAHRNYDLTKMPDDYIKVPCQKPGEHRHDRRDCGQADLTAAFAEAWLDRPGPAPRAR